VLLNKRDYPEFDGPGDITEPVPPTQRPGSMGAAFGQELARRAVLALRLSVTVRRMSPLFTTAAVDGLGSIPEETYTLSHDLEAELVSRLSAWIVDASRK
jgi:hypothetical protein